MKNFQYLFFLSLALLVFSCGEDDQLHPTVDVEVNFKANYGDELLLMNKNYQYDDTTLMTFTEASFYISDVVLSKNFDGVTEETGLIDLALVDFSDFTQSQAAIAANGLSFFSANIPVDSYNGLKIGLGVPADLNNTVTPSDQNLGADHPLKSAAHYWSGWQSYMFVKLEGFIDWNHNGVFDSATESFLYHTGKNEAYENAFVLKDIVLKEGDQPKLNLVLDFKRVFYQANGIPNFDAQQFRATHNPDDFPFIQQWMGYFSQAFSM